MRVRHWTGGSIDIPLSNLRWWWVWATSWIRWYYWNWRATRARVRLMNAKRQWRAVSPFGSVDLGIVTEREAVDRTAKFGTINFVDSPNGVIIYGSENGGPPAK